MDGGEDDGRVRKSADDLEVDGRTAVKMMDGGPEVEDGRGVDGHP